MEHDFWNDLFVIIGQYILPILALPIIVGFIKWKNLNQALRVFFYSFSVYFLLNAFDIVYFLTAEAHLELFRPWLEITDYTNLFTLIAYQLNTFLLLGLYFTFLFTKPSQKMVIRILSYGLAFLAVISYIYEKGWRNYGTIGPITEALFRFLVPIVFLWQLSQKHLGVKLINMPNFWIALGLILPNLVGLILFLLGDYLYTELPVLFYQHSLVKNLFVISSAVFYSIAFWKSNSVHYN